jgi:hypothetical protein
LSLSALLYESLVTHVMFLMSMKTARGPQLLYYRSVRWFVLHLLTFQCLYFNNTRSLLQNLQTLYFDYTL